MGKKGADDFRELTFKARSSLATMYLVLGVFQVLVGLLGVVAQTPVGFFLLAGPLLIWISRWFATADLLHLRRDSLIVRIAPMRAAQELSYGEIDEIVTRGPKVASLRVRGRDVRLPLAALPPDDVERALAAIQEGRERGWASSTAPLGAASGG